MKHKHVKMLIAGLALTLVTALGVGTMTWADSALSTKPVTIVKEDGTIIKSAIESDRTLYFGSKQPQDITKDVLERLRTDKAIKKDSLTAKDVSITLKSELVFDEEKNEFVESENDIKDVMTIKDDEITFAKEGFFLAEVSIKDEKLNVIFDIDDKVLAYADLNDWVVLNNTKSPDFSVKFDSKEIKSVKYDDSKVKVGTDGKYVLTYTITDAKDHVVKKEVLVTVGDKKVVNELSEKGVWVANGKTVAGNSSTTKPVVKPENKPSKPSKPENSGNHGEQNPSVPNRPEKPETPDVPSVPDKPEIPETPDKPIIPDKPEVPETPEKPEVPEHTHAWNDGIVTKEPTCTEAGEKTYTCTCGDTKTEPIQALGHDLKETVITEPTCGTAGSKEITCSRCDFKDTKEIPATGNHAYGDWVIVKEATCTEEGLRTQTCANCGDVKKEVLPKVDHTWNEGEVSKQPTCTEDGIKTFTCTVCGDTKTEVIPALGHAWSDWDIKDSTCGQEGEKTRHCTRTGCTATETVKIPASENHKWNDGVVTKNATCTEQGEITYTCNDCGHTKVEKTPALGHDLKEVILKQPTCSESGLKAMVCQRPGCDHKENEVSIPATGEHHWDEGVVTKQPTCITKGEKTYTCEHCGEKRYEEIGLIDHLWEEIWEKGPDKTVTEVHAFCGGCGKDFGPGPEGAQAALEHTMMDFNDGCSNYYADEVTVTIPGEDILVGHKCKMCGKKDY